MKTEPNPPSKRKYDRDSCEARTRTAIAYLQGLHAAAIKEFGRPIPFLANAIISLEYALAELPILRAGEPGDYDPRPSSEDVQAMQDETGFLTGPSRLGVELESFEVVLAKDRALDRTRARVATLEREQALENEPEHVQADVRATMALWRTLRLGRGPRTAEARISAPE